jgi:hypothetical protein
MDDIEELENAVRRGFQLGLDSIVVTPRPVTGWSVEIKRKDGTAFLCSSGLGNYPPIWSKRNRKYAVEHKKRAIELGHKAKVVSVLYMEPQIIRKS